VQDPDTNFENWLPATSAPGRADLLPRLRAPIRFWNQLPAFVPIADCRAGLAPGSL